MSDEPVDERAEAKRLAEELHSDEIKRKDLVSLSTHEVFCALSIMWDGSSCTLQGRMPLFSAR